MRKLHLILRSLNISWRLFLSLEEPGALPFAFSWSTTWLGRFFVVEASPEACKNLGKHFAAFCELNRHFEFRHLFMILYNFLGLSWRIRKPHMFCLCFPLLGDWLAELPWSIPQPAEQGSPQASKGSKQPLQAVPHLNCFNPPKKIVQDMKYRGLAYHAFQNHSIILGLSHLSVQTPRVMLQTNL